MVPVLTHDAADLGVPLDQGRALAQLRGLDRGPLSSRARSNDHHVVVVLSHPSPAHP